MTAVSKRFVLSVLIALCLCAALAPGAAGAQESELSMAIRAALMSDPNTANMSEADLDALVAALATEAESEGVTAQDIGWRPTEPAYFEEYYAPTGVGSCSNMPAFFCALSDAFGFSGSNLLIPLGLLITSGILLFLIGSMLLHRHGHHPIQGAIGTPISSSGLYT